MIVYISQCHCLNSSHHLLGPLCPQICSLHLCPYPYSTNKFVSIIFIDAICCCLVAQLCLFATPWTAAHQAFLSFTISQSLLKLMSFESIMPSNHLILYHPLLLPSIFLSIRVFSNESIRCIRWLKYWSFSFIISPSNEYSGLISFRMDWLDCLAVQGILKGLLQHHSSKASTLQCSAFFFFFFCNC